MAQLRTSVPPSSTTQSARTGMTPSRRRWRRRLEPYTLVAPGIAILGLFFLAPSIYNIALSFQHVTLFELGEGGEWAGLSNFREMLTDSLTRLSTKNTVFWLTIPTVVARIVLGLLLALLVNASVFRRWHMSWLVRSLLLIPWITPPVVAVAAWKWLLDARYGAVNHLLLELGVIDEGIPFLAKTSTVWPSIQVMLTWRELPFVVIAFLAGLQSIPSDLKEAARVDGASERRIFFSVTLPLLRPVLTVVALLTTIWTFNNFVYVWLATRGGPGDYTQVLATQMYSTAFNDYRIGAGAAIGVFMSLIMLVFAIVYFMTVMRDREA